MHWQKAPGSFQLIYHCRIRAVCVDKKYFASILPFFFVEASVLDRNVIRECRTRFRYVGNVNRILNISDSYFGVVEYRRDLYSKRYQRCKSGAAVRYAPLVRGLDVWGYAKKFKRQGTKTFEWRTEDSPASNPRDGESNTVRRYRGWNWSNMKLLFKR